ncbi:hypothetical protein M513_13111 [Trichuris suis]|uniref:Uncharacterized protein n=1 Tax=Trichuris suis TaxID=68888 RepID=A0A085LM13_9BILA|nr:hypothetical protein M513_13111 [Trichuris suis]
METALEFDKCLSVAVQTLEYERQQVILEAPSAQKAYSSLIAFANGSFRNCTLYTVCKSNRKRAIHDGIGPVKPKIQIMNELLDKH